MGASRSTEYRITVAMCTPGLAEKSCPTPPPPGLAQTRRSPGIRRRDVTSGENLVWCATDRLPALVGCRTPNVYTPSPRTATGWRLKLAQRSNSPTSSLELAELAALGAEDLARRASSRGSRLGVDRLIMLDDDPWSSRSIARWRHVAPSVTPVS